MKVSDFIHMAQIADRARYPVEISVKEAGLVLVAHGPNREGGSAVAQHVIDWARLEVAYTPAALIHGVIEDLVDRIDGLVADAR